MILKRKSLKTKAIITILHNPTGSVLDEDIIRSIYNICEKHSVYLISDEVYGRMIFDDLKNKFSLLLKLINVRKEQFLFILLVKLLQ